LQTTALSEEQLAHVTEAIYQHGYGIIPDFFESDFIQQLTQRVIESNALKKAGIGRQSNHQRNSDIRRDAILWLNNEHPTDQKYLAQMEAIRVTLNRQLFMGLFDYESHFAHYSKGAFYKKHLDAFKGRSNRVLTTVAYLDNHWKPGDGGELSLYNEQDKLIAKVPPKAGTFVVFLSDEFPHEVHTCHDDRYSIAGWFRINTSRSTKVDPPQ
jgi:SM-20-related protein